MHTQEHLDTLTLMARVKLAQAGEISWNEVNRPEADARRIQKEEEAKSVHERLAGHKLASSARQISERRQAQRYKERNRRKAFYEFMLAEGVNMLKTVTLPHMPRTLVRA